MLSLFQKYAAGYVTFSQVLGRILLAPASEIEFLAGRRDALRRAAEFMGYMMLSYSLLYILTFQRSLSDVTPLVIFLVAAAIFSAVATLNGFVAWRICRSDAPVEGFAVTALYMNATVVCLMAVISLFANAAFRLTNPELAVTYGTALSNCDGGVFEKGRRLQDIVEMDPVVTQISNVANVAILIILIWGLVTGFRCIYRIAPLPAARRIAATLLTIAIGTVTTALALVVLVPIYGHLSGC